MIVECLRAVEFTAPYPWAYSAEHEPIREGTALVVRADAESLRPRDVGQPVLHVEGWPVEVLRVEDDLALVLAPVRVTGEVSVWLGDPVLPERVDAVQRARIPRVGFTPGRIDTLLVVTGRKSLLRALDGWCL